MFADGQLSMFVNGPLAEVWHGKKRSCEGTLDAQTAHTDDTSPISGHPVRKLM